MHNMINLSHYNMQLNYNIIKFSQGHNKEVRQTEQHHQLECKCRIKTRCPLNGDCRKEDVIISVQH